MTWEGNEASLQDFDNVLASSTRPALISPVFKPMSPRHSFAKSPLANIAPIDSHSTVIPEQPINKQSQLSGVRVVGDMVFDPAQMRWINTGQDGEDELDFGDDEGEDDSFSDLKPDYWKEGETRRLKTRKSFAHGDPGSASEHDDGDCWDEDHFASMTHLAQQRHGKEVQPWLGKLALNSSKERAHLWDILKML